MRILIFIVIILSASLCITTETHARMADTYVFQDSLTETRYKALVKELRCPKCQNQNLADSNAPIAQDLRREVYDLLQQGKSDGEIVDFMVKRYGEFVLYRPRISSVTYVLWFGPAILLLVGLTIVVVMVKRRRADKKPAVLSAEQKAKLDQLLKDK